MSLRRFSCRNAYSILRIELNVFESIILFVNQACAIGTTLEYSNDQTLVDVGGYISELDIFYCLIIGDWPIFRAIFVSWYWFTFLVWLGVLLKKSH
jgi:hypothetical protein